MRRLGRLAFALIVFATFVVAIFSWHPKTLFDFDASHYSSIAYDIDRHGTFSNGIWDQVDSTQAAPPPGMFFGPLYPALVAAMMQVDPRFHRTVACWVTADARDQDGTLLCERYATPMLLLHALALALGVLAIARAGELMFRSEPVFWIAGVLATIGLVFESELFSFVMTESLTVGFFSVFAWRCAVAWQSQRARDGLIAGLVLGLLILHRPSYQALVPVCMVLFALAGWLVLRSARLAVGQAAVFVLGCLLVVGPWVARNYVSVGKFGLTEEYGSAALIERFAFNDMTAREFSLAFPFCLPGIGPPVVKALAGGDAMRRFQWDAPGSFFEVGRTLRGDLAREHGSLDAAIRPLIKAELGTNWPTHLLVSIPLGWCGMWAGGVASLLLVPLFFVAAWRAAWRREWLFLFYSAPGLAMLAAHALLANQYTRYNLVLIGSFAIGAAWLMSDTVVRAWTRHARA